MFKRKPSEVEALQTMVAELTTALQSAQDMIVKMNDQPILVSIVREGRMNRFTFMRANNVVMVSTYGTWDDDVTSWKKDLLE